MLTHILVVQLGEHASEPLERVLYDFSTAISQCEGVRKVVWGKNSNATGAVRGYDYVCVSELDDREVLDNHYWEHPAHRVLLEVLPGLCESRFALDIE